ncbi:MAG: cache domain-containing protein [Dongiaceae bacterium]
MRKRMRFWLAILVTGSMAALSACASSDAERGSAGEAKDMVERAIDTYDAQGTASFAAMTAPSTEFVDRDLYVFVIAPDRLLVAHGASADLIGDDVTVLVDANGKGFGREFVERATPEGAWVDYTWLDPLSGEQVQKSSWVVLHDGHIFGTGIYKP